MWLPLPHQPHLSFPFHFISFPLHLHLSILILLYVPRLIYKYAALYTPEFYIQNRFNVQLNFYLHSLGIVYPALGLILEQRLFFTNFFVRFSFPVLAGVPRYLFCTSLLLRFSLSCTSWSTKISIMSSSLRFSLSCASWSTKIYILFQLVVKVPSILKQLQYQDIYSVPAC